VRIRTVREDSPLGRFTYCEWQPENLRGLLDLVWWAEGCAAFPRKRIFPNGRLELLVNLGPPLRLVEGAGEEEMRRGWLCGVQSGPVVVEMTGARGYSNVLALRLRPAGVYALLAHPIHELSGFNLDLVDVVGRAGAELHERCAGARSVAERFQIAADWLFARVQAAPPMDPAIAWTAARIESSAGRSPIAALREQTGLSKTRLATAFREQVGVTPKHYARLFRFRRALGLLHDSPAPLAEVAFEAGYYDQPHMAGEFRALSGLSAGEYRAAPRFTQTKSVAEGR